MVVWQDAGGPRLKDQQCVWEPSPLHSRQLSVIFVHFFPVFALFHGIFSSCGPVEAVCDKLGFSINQFPVLKNLIEVSCASGSDLK